MKKLFAFVGVLLSVLPLLFSCHIPLRPITSENTTNKIPTDTEGEDNKMIYSDIERQALPFWETDTIFNECISFIEQSSGEKIAKLLFEPTEIIEITDNSGKVSLKEGVHYKKNESDNQELIWFKGNSEFETPYFTEIFASGNDSRYLNKSGVQQCTDESLFGPQLYVTYKYDKQNSKQFSMDFKGEVLPLATSKLANKEEINILFYGDSIFTGADSSSKKRFIAGEERESAAQRPPYQKNFYTLVAEMLEFKYDSKINIFNFSVGGQSSDWGVETLTYGSKLSDRGVDIPAEFYKNVDYDLVIIGFGMNDGSRTAEYLAANIKRIIDIISAHHSNCEFVVLSPMLPNPLAGRFSGNQDTFSPELEKLEKQGVAFVDVNQLHKEILKTKHYYTTTGNCINHPNDWLVRLYAQSILSALVDF